MRREEKFNIKIKRESYKDMKQKFRKTDKFDKSRKREELENIKRNTWDESNIKIRRSERERKRKKREES